MAQKEIHSTNSTGYKSIQLVPNNQEKVNEAEIWLKFKDGDEEAFIWIYRTYFETLYNYAGQFDLDFDLVKDQIQELFIYIRKRRAQLADVKSIKFYLFKSLRRRLLAYKKQRFSFLSLFSVESKKFFNIEIVDSSEVKLINQSLDDEIIERLSNSIDKLTA